MRLIPVLDVKAGRVVRGVAGCREEYQPIQSRLTSSSNPADVARALCTNFDCRELYIADLDAIAGAEFNSARYSQIAELGCELLIDAGCSTVERAHELHTILSTQSPHSATIVGLESLDSIKTLAEVSKVVAGRRAVFSLDLFEGRPWSTESDWVNQSPAEIVAMAVEFGFHRFILLDVSSVGIGQGVTTLPLCSDLRDAFPEIELITGGGVRGPHDVIELSRVGCDAVLVASALHDGRFSVLDWQKLSAQLNVT